MQFLGKILGNFSWQALFPWQFRHFDDFTKIPDISLTSLKFPNISRFSRQMVTLLYWTGWPFTVYSLRFSPSHPGQLNLAIPLWVNRTRTGDGYSNLRWNSEFCATNNRSCKQENAGIRTQLVKGATVAINIAGCEAKWSRTGQYAC